MSTSRASRRGWWCIPAFLALALLLAGYANASELLVQRAMNGGIQLAWSPVAGATDYQVHYTNYYSELNATTAKQSDPTAGCWRQARPVPRRRCLAMNSYAINIQYYQKNDNCPLGRSVRAACETLAAGATGFLISGIRMRGVGQALKSRVPKRHFAVPDKAARLISNE